VTASSKQRVFCDSGRPRRIWKDNIKMDLRELVWVGMDLIHLAQDRDLWRALVNTNDASGSLKCI
jgi:hypothetical protein